MAFKFNLRDKWIFCLKSQPERRFTAKEIAEWIFAHYREDCERKRKNSEQDLNDDSRLISQISQELKPRLIEEIRHIKIIAGWPRKFYWTDKSDEQEIIETEGKPHISETDNSETPFKEAELYPLLADFLYAEFSIYSKRIDEKTSKNSRGKGGNKWLHPDIVGIEDLSNRWSPTVKDCAKRAYSEHIMLWSFEVKLKLNTSNIRKSFFQAVSNSSWAHYGYLVAAEINENAEDELRMLANAHNIGIIRLDPENPAESEIFISAKSAKQTDWDIVNRIAEENSDFADYLELVKTTYSGTALKWQKGWYSVK